MDIMRLHTLRFFLQAAESLVFDGAIWAGKIRFWWWGLVLRGGRVGLSLTKECVFFNFARKRIRFLGYVGCR